jgi:hypothetical protein
MGWVIVLMDDQWCGCRTALLVLSPSSRYTIKDDARKRSLVATKPPHSKNCIGTLLAFESQVKIRPAFPCQNKIRGPQPQFYYGLAATVDPVKSSGGSKKH